MGLEGFNIMGINIYWSIGHNELKFKKGLNYLYRGRKLNIHETFRRHKTFFLTSSAVLWIYILCPKRKYFTKIQIRKQKTTTWDSTADRILLLKDLGTDSFNTEGEKKGRQHEYLTPDNCSLNKSTTRFPVQLNWQVNYCNDLWCRRILVPHQF